MSAELSLQEIKKEWHGTLRAYLTGFIACVILTSLSFYLVVGEVLSGQLLYHTLTALAVAQAVVQLRLFLHVGQEPKPRWESIIFCVMVFMLLVIAIGTLWIMHDLNERTMSNMTEMMTNTADRFTHD